MGECWCCCRCSFVFEAFAVSRREWRLFPIWLGQVEFNRISQRTPETGFCSQTQTTTNNQQPTHEHNSTRANNAEALTPPAQQAACPSLFHRRRHQAGLCPGPRCRPDHTPAPGTEPASQQLCESKRTDSGPEGAGQRGRRRQVSSHWRPAVGQTNQDGKDAGLSGRLAGRALATVCIESFFPLPWSACLINSSVPETNRSQCSIWSILLADKEPHPLEFQTYYYRHRQDFLNRHGYNMLLERGSNGESILCYSILFRKMELVRWMLGCWKYADLPATSGKGGEPTELLKFPLLPQIINMSYQNNQFYGETAAHIVSVIFKDTAANMEEWKEQVGSFFYFFI
ncbi:hypothetical protein BJ741DRAFT_131281 [Chytriomyces cf. hyalinus JEL632]|nr:hypothetical protein BJ741DRAFT_131281 [Chytriomyces cf. hyalinus JEL632]